MKDTFCPRCGSRISSPALPCSLCGKTLSRPPLLPYWLGGTVILTVVLALICFFGISAYRDRLFNSFQPARCTILSKKIQVDQHYTTTTNDDGSTGSELTYTYKPSITYVLMTADEQKLTSLEGYSVPDTINYGSKEQAQRVLDQYALNQTYNCWYSSVAPKSSGLVLQSDSAKNAIASAIITLLYIPIASCLLYLQVYRKRYLLRAGSKAVSPRPIRWWLIGLSISLCLFTSAIIALWLL